MTAPNNFIMNTDYLSIAQSGKNTLTLIKNGGTVPAYGQIIEQTDFTAPSDKGSIERFFVSINDADYKLGSVADSPTGGGIVIYRISPTTIRVEFAVNNIQGSSPITYPLTKFIIKVVTFNPPNVF